MQPTTPIDADRGRGGWLRNVALLRSLVLINSRAYDARRNSTLPTFPCRAGGAQPITAMKMASLVLNHQRLRSHAIFMQRGAPQAHDACREIALSLTIPVQPARSTANVLNEVLRREFKFRRYGERYGTAQKAGIRSGAKSIRMKMVGTRRLELLTSTVSR